jgi:hypothetical protein
MGNAKGGVIKDEDSEYFYMVGSCEEMIKFELTTYV